MNFADRMRQLGALIAAHAPSIAATETVVNEAGAVLAAAVPGAAPVVAAISAVEHVGNQAADLVQEVTTTVAAPVAPTPTTAPTPIAQDVASIAADSLAGAAQATPSQLHARVVALETAILDMLPLLGHLAGKFNL